MKKKHKGKQKLKCSKKKNKHHIRPKSRGGGGGENLVLLCMACHNKLHHDFGTMTPDEIIAFLVTHYWNDQWFWVKKSLDRFSHINKLGEKV